MALNFPNNPGIGSVYTDNTSGFSYEWDGTVWKSYSVTSANNIRILDDISGLFNGSTQTFALTSGSSAVTPASTQSLIINLGGVIQDPSDDYTISGSNIAFSTAPAAGLSFSGILLGTAVSIVTIPDGTATGGSLTVSGNLSVVGFTTTKNIHATGIITASSGFVGNVTGTATGLSGSPNITVGVATASSFSGSLTGSASTASFATTSFGLSGSPNITVGVATAIEYDITGSTNSFSAGGLNVGVATLTTLSGTSGLVSVGTTIRTKGFSETQNSVAIGGTILTLDASQGTVFTHTTSAQIGIVSFTGIRTDTAGTQTFTVLVNQGAVAVNTTGASGIGTQLASIRITPGNVGYSTHIKVGGGSSITLTNSVGALDILTFIVSYNGATSIANTSFTVVGFAATDFRNAII